MYALKYSTSPRHVTSLPLIDFINRFFGASSLGINLPRYSLNSSSISKKIKKLKVEMWMMESSQEQIKVNHIF